MKTNDFLPSKFLLALAATAALMPSAYASTISTEFNLSDGFVTGGFAPVTLASPSGSFTTTFSGGQQQQMFDGPSYNNGPAGFLFVNGTFTGASGNSVAGDGVTDDAGLIDFSGAGVTNVSFFAANRANGPATTLNIFGVDDTTLLGSILVANTVNQGPGSALTVIDSANFGGALIGSIGIDLPGPVMNPPYVLAIDNFSATAVPIPAALPLFISAIAGLGVFGRRRRAKQMEVATA